MFSHFINAFFSYIVVGEKGELPGEDILIQKGFSILTTVVLNDLRMAHKLSFQVIAIGMVQDSPYMKFTS
jgi:hypothetical protein